MVHRLLSRAGLLLTRHTAPATAVAMLVAAVLVPAAALATNTRVEIANYAWSNKEVHVNLGEKVTWDWLGPDLAHSVTGISPNDLQWDSDPGTDAPSHQAGDEYTIQFDEPGVYLFQCKLHAAVRGEVIVANVPGEPNSDPGPRPPLNVDTLRPTLGEVALSRRTTKNTKGIKTSAHISEKGSLDAEYYRFNSKGKRVYNGYHSWKTYIGINHFALGARWKHFRSKPGRYEAVLRVTDTANNVSKAITKHFSIAGG